MILDGSLVILPGYGRTVLTFDELSPMVVVQTEYIVSRRCCSNCIGMGLGLTKFGADFRTMPGQLKSSTPAIPAIRSGFC